MALTKQIVADKIELIEDNSIQVRTVTRIMEDDNEISSSFHRQALTPGEDLTGQDPQVVAIANVIWTTEVVTAYQAKVEAVRQAALNGEA